MKKEPKLKKIEITIPPIFIKEIPIDIKDKIKLKKIKLRK